MLKYTHKDNPNFTFLFIDNPLLPYYRLLRKLNMEGINTSIEKKTNNNNTIKDPSQPVCPYATPGTEEKIIIDKMAPFVVQYGAKFELSVRDKKTTNPLFDFMKPVNKYHPFYKWRIGLLRQKLDIDKDALAIGLEDNDDTLIKEFREIGEIIKREEEEARKKDNGKQERKDKLKKRKDS